MKLKYQIVEITNVGAEVKKNINFAMKERK